MRELNSTDMLPLFFDRLDGGVGVPITEEGIRDAISDVPTRVRATSLKVIIDFVDYPAVESQIQLRLQTVRLPYISSGRLAKLVAGRVRSYMQSLKYTLVPGKSGNWRVGTGPGCLSVGDIVLVGIVYVSRGRIMPLLQVRADYFDGASTLSIP
ncbi:hypothetical protein PENSPDRAFT_759655 [Peniophora sp. CONT]|nr:hypothetical protein PENSPDRAFT_759655 [Peniophora sp. CONT]